MKYLQHEAKYIVDLVGPERREDEVPTTQVTSVGDHHNTGAQLYTRL